MVDADLGELLEQGLVIGTFEVGNNVLPVAPIPFGGDLMSMAEVWCESSAVDKH